MCKEKNDKSDEKKTEVKPTEESTTEGQIKDLLNLWDDEWKKLTKAVTDEKDKYEFFYKKFKAVYEETKRKKDNNKLQNFRWKKIFIVIYVVLQILFFGYILINNVITDWTDAVYAMVGWAVLTYLVGSIISKWLDIKKYQETWVRHSNHCIAMEQEMVKFIFNLGIYEVCGDKRKTFIMQVLKIWKNNQKEFSRNMYRKEMPLLDVFSPLIDLAGNGKKNHGKKKRSLPETKSESEQQFRSN